MSDVKEEKRKEREKRNMKDSKKWEAASSQPVDIPLASPGTSDISAALLKSIEVLREGAKRKVGGGGDEFDKGGRPILFFEVSIGRDFSSSAAVSFG
jgi:hypothetical protein